MSSFWKHSEEVNWSGSAMFVIQYVNLYQQWSGSAVFVIQYVNLYQQWSGSAMFVIQYANLYQQSGVSNLIGSQVEMGVAS